MPENPKIHSASPQKNYSFEGFVFHLDTDELFCEQTQQTHKLEPQASQLLTLLVQSQEKVLSKAFLLKTLWPNTVVEQNNLYQVLAKLRKLLNDSSRNPKYIKTIPKKGYCFIAQVTTTKVEPTESTIKKLSIKHICIALILFLSVVLFSYFLVQPANKLPTATRYKLEDVSYQLGLEFDVSVHKKHNLMAYIKDIKSLHIANKQGEVIYEKHSDFRLAFPSWQPNKKLLAYWQYRQDQCELFVITPQGALNYQAPSIKCDIKSAPAIKPVWINEETLLLTIKQDGDIKIYRYQLGNDVLTTMPLAFKEDIKPAGIINAWQDQTYYLINNINQSTSLIDVKGNEVLKWDFPIWLYEYDAKTQKIISNDHTQGKNLIATSIDGNMTKIISSVEGIFTSLSTDNKGDIYTAIEHWQVNIRDNSENALFSTSSIDYLTNTNSDGETIFASKRTGFYEVYLSKDGKLQQLSNHKTQQFIKFLEWRPDFAMLLSNRSGRLAVYDKQSEVLQVATSLLHSIKNIGWVNNHSFFAFDGEKVIIYDLLGQVISEHTVKGQGLYYNYQQKTWLLFNNGQISTLKSLTDKAAHLVTLTDIQISTLKNIRIKNNKLYWQSTWSHEDKIWQLTLDGRKTVELVKEGQLIWHFDITAKGDINVSKMESIQGDIKRLVPIQAF